MYDVLIVEDDPMVAMINEQYVRRNGQFNIVGKCRDGASALLFLEKQQVDLLILDVYMPRMDGLETLRRIREKKIPVEAIMVTAANDRTAVEEAIHLGAVDYLVKPFTFDRFQIALEKFSAQMSAMRGADVFSQKSIDDIIEKQCKRDDEPPPKGINDKTLEVILECINRSGGEWLTGDDIAEKTGLSSVTARRYLNYLVQIGAVTGQLNYETGGRPCMLYRMK